MYYYVGPHLNRGSSGYHDYITGMDALTSHDAIMGTPVLLVWKMCRVQYSQDYSVKI